MKRYVLIILLGLIFTITGCLDDDGYSLNDMWVGFGMVEQVNSDPMDYRIHMDNGDVLMPVASGYQLPWYYQGTNDPNSRLKTGDDGNIDLYQVKVNSVKKILLKGILDITEENRDSIGNDPVIVRNCWQTDGLLNFEIKYWGRYEVHYINLVKKPGELTGESQPVELELRHNANGDLEDIPYSAFVSFRLEEIQVAGLDSVRFIVTSTDYDGKEFEYEGVYRYHENN